MSSSTLRIKSTNVTTPYTKFPRQYFLRHFLPTTHLFLIVDGFYLKLVDSVYTGPVTKYE